MVAHERWAVPALMIYRRNSHVLFSVNDLAETDRPRRLFHDAIAHPWLVEGAPDVDPNVRVDFRRLVWILYEAAYVAICLLTARTTPILSPGRIGRSLVPRTIPKHWLHGLADASAMLRVQIRANV